MPAVSVKSGWHGSRCCMSTWPKKEVAQPPGLSTAKHAERVKRGERAARGQPNIVTVYDVVVNRIAL